MAAGNWWRSCGKPFASRKVLIVHERRELNMQLAVLTKTEQELRSHLAACSEPLYSSASRLCCRRTHSFGTISGLPLTSFCSFLPLILLWRRWNARDFPVFFTFAIFSSVGQLACLRGRYCSMGHSARRFLARVLGRLLLEGILKFALIGEIFAHVFGSYHVVGTVRENSHSRRRSLFWFLQPLWRPRMRLKSNSSASFPDRTFLSRRST